MSDNQLSLDGIPDEFMQGQIKVECPYLLQMVYELRITRKLNQHGQIWVKGVLQEEAGKECIHQVGSKAPIVVYGEKDSEKILLFSGVVIDVSISYHDCIYYVEINGLSWSSLLDYEEKSRSFQNKEMSYSALIQQVLTNYQGSAFVNSTASPDQEIGKFILQYRETDWEFCKRLATHFQTQLVADVLGRRPRLWFGLPKNIETIKSAGEVTIQKDATQYQEAVAAGFWVQVKNVSNWVIL